MGGEAAGGTMTTEICDWLKGLGTHVRNVVAVRLVLRTRKGVETWEGARYEHVGHYESGMGAVRDGRKKEGDEYVEPKYYFRGVRPKCTARGDRHVFVFPGDDGDWYVSGYYDGGPTDFQSGPNFMLGRWPHEEFKERIDACDRKKSIRVPVEIEWAAKPPEEVAHAE
jgi:hypothetical protein